MGLFSRKEEKEPEDFLTEIDGIRFYADRVEYKDKKVRYDDITYIVAPHVQAPIYFIVRTGDLVHFKKDSIEALAFLIARCPNARVG